MDGRLRPVHALGRLTSASFEQRSPTRRAAAWTLAIVGPGLLTAAALPFRARLGLAGFLLFTLLIVIAAALLSGIVPALCAVLLGFLLGGFFFIAPYDSFGVYLRLDDVPLIAYLVVGVVLSLLVDDLAAIATANAHGRNQLAASRARIVAASDDTRRRIERDLHDGAQQRLASLALAVRTAQKSVPAELDELRDELAAVADGLSDTMDELREMARGIHPAILAEGGIGPALRTLARRCAVPVELDVQSSSRLPEPIEVAAYYIVSESLTNIVKHADASVAHVHVARSDHSLQISIRDDGAGGADPSLGTGLTGLADRVGALGGTMTTDSRSGLGTNVRAQLPITS